MIDTEIWMEFIWPVLQEKWKLNKQLMMMEYHYNLLNSWNQEWRKKWDTN